MSNVNNGVVKIGTKVQTCNCCRRNVKCEPFVRLVVNGFVNANLCHKCIEQFYKDLKTTFKDHKVKERLFLEKLGDEIP